MKNYYKKTRIFSRVGFALIITLLIGMNSCEDFVTINPPASQIVTSSVFNNWGTANAALVSIYPQVASFNKNIQDYTGLYGDEFRTNNTGGLDRAVFTNALEPITLAPSQVWNSGFNIIYQANAVIEGCLNSETLSQQQTSILIGEAKFTRAFSNFYLCNLYGDIPLVLTTDYDVNSRLQRRPKEEVFQQIVEDLEDARHLLGTEYLDSEGNSGTTERVRPNMYAATALLARVYLYQRKHALANELATIVISENSRHDTVPLENVFLKNNKEAIWQIPPSSSGLITSTPDGNYIITVNNPRLFLSDNLMSAFEDGDVRGTVWVTKFQPTNNETLIFPFPHKYKHGGNNTFPTATEYYTALRLGEQYLIRAEARAHLGNVTAAQQDLNVIRKRAGLPATHAQSIEELLEAILHERQVELFCEWGHRWLDLNRTESADNLMTIVAPQKGGEWYPYKKLWPLLQTELDRNLNLTQNPGYGTVSNSN